MATPVARGRLSGKSDGVEDFISAPVANTVNVDADSILSAKWTISFICSCVK